MRLLELLMGGFTQIRHHKLRSFLTLIGIILGTGSIIFMTSMLNGIIVSVWDGFEELGYDGVMYVVARQPKDSVQRARFALNEGLMPDDVRVLLDRKELVTAAAPVQYTRLVFQAGGASREVRVAGVNAAYSAVRKRFTQLGRQLNENDMNTYARVCILGHRLRLRLFGSDNPVGRQIVIGDTRFMVVGVGEKLGNEFVNDGDFIEEMEGALIPLPTLRKYFSGEDAPLDYIAVKTTAIDSLGRVQSEIQASLTTAHRGVGNFKIENIAQEMVKQRGQVKEIVVNWQVVLGTIASISLLVGGLGLFSVMIISINERLYEIGMRKAIGASDLEIFVMFMVESVTLALVGAGIGVGVGLGFVKAVAGFFPSGLPVDWVGVGWAIGVAVTLGLGFGLYPALKASRMAPVDAMRGA